MLCNPVNEILCRSSNYKLDLLTIKLICFVTFAQIPLGNYNRGSSKPNGTYNLKTGHNAHPNSILRFVIDIKCQSCWKRLTRFRSSECWRRFDFGEWLLVLEATTESMEANLFAGFLIASIQITATNFSQFRQQFGNLFGMPLLSARIQGK